MYKELISIVIPVKEKEEVVSKFISGNLDILNHCTVIVIDSGGGEELTKVATLYSKIDRDMSTARKLGYIPVKTPYILNLDVDTILPDGYLEDALVLLDNSKVVVVALDYENLQGHLAFGSSLWKSDILRKLYDYKEGNIICECCHLWHKVLQSEYKIETLLYRAIHLKENS
jgi:hypothetical protein